MSSNPIISVVMPVYNGERFLREAIESILNQTYDNFEFLIIYDHSADNTLSIIQEFQKQDDRIVLINGDGKKLIHALNKGIGKAKGKWIARMDADDVSLPTRFESQIHHMSCLGLDVCGGHSLLIDSDGKINGIGIVPRTHDLCGLSMMFMVPFAHSSVMISKDFLINSSLEYGQSKYQIAEDYDLWVRMFSQGAKFGNVDDVVIRYRVLDDSLSVLNASGSRRDVRGILKQHRFEHHHRLSKVVKNVDIKLLSEGDKSLVARYLINRAIIRFDVFGLYKLKDVSMKNIVITILSEAQRLLTKFSWHGCLTYLK